ncbi:MAG: hypothetical protein ACYDBB_04000 [Armatimonadota bacterium]
MSHAADMRTWLVWTGMCLLVCGLSVAGYGKVAPRQITLQEQLNQTYAQELVLYPFTAAKGTCAQSSVRVTGPRGPVPAQLTEVTYWPGRVKSVKTAKLALLVDKLTPLATNTYTVTFGTKAAPAMKSDLRLVSGKNTVELTTSHLGIRLPLGGMTYPAPVAAKDVPGPLQAMRLQQGAWAGMSALTGEMLVKSWTARVTDGGPAFARVAIAYTFADSSTLTLAATLAAGDSAVRWEMQQSADNPAQGIVFQLPPVPGVKQAIYPKGYGQWAKDRTQAVTPSEKPFCFLSPNSSVINIFADHPSTIRLAPEGGQELYLCSRDPGAWVDPIPLTYHGVKEWHLDAIPGMWATWQQKSIPVLYAADGTVSLQVNLAKGARKWSIGAGAPLVGEELDRIKNLVLDWPSSPKVKSPRVFVSREDAVEAWKRTATEPDLAQRLMLPHPNYIYANAGMNAYLNPAVTDPKVGKAAVDSLRAQLGMMGKFDVMRYAIAAACSYDALIDSPLLTAQERKLFRAQMAYLAYLLADPMCWSMERGYNSGNPNMSTSYTFTQGIAACALSDHPMAKQWADRCNRWMDKWLTDEVGTNGEWKSEGGHYMHAGVPPLVVYAPAAQRAGFADFTTDPRLKKLILYMAKTYTPNDAQRKNLRVSPAFGRGTSGDTCAIFGVAARMYAASDPELSRTMQWMWAADGYPANIGDWRLGGFEGYYLDKRLPQQPPVWASELFPNLGGLLRAGFGTDQESYVNVLSHVDSRRNLDIWTPEIGGIAQWFGRGKPLSTCFSTETGYAERHELLRNGVRLSHNWGAPADVRAPFGYYTKIQDADFATLPSADYVRSTIVNTTVDDRDWFPKNMPATPKETPAKTGTLSWTRQLLFLKDADPAGPAYLVLRDTTQGGEPTAWQFWTLSEKLGATAQAQDMTAFLADKPGQAILPARELPMSDRYTAAGQVGMDIEYFVASPANTPRHTLRYGGFDNSRISQYQDLLHLQLPGDGAYYVALFPHPRTEAAPTFTTLDGGKIIKVSGQFGTDYAFIAKAETTATAEGITVRGTVAAVQQRPTGITLSLGAAGEVRSGEYGLTAPSAASLQVLPAALTVNRPSAVPGGLLTVHAPAGWTVKNAPAGVKLVANGTEYQLTLPEGVATVVLVKAP